MPLRPRATLVRGIGTLPVTTLPSMPAPVHGLATEQGAPQLARGQPACNGVRAAVPRARTHPASVSAAALPPRRNAPPAKLWRFCRMRSRVPTRPSWRCSRRSSLIPAGSIRSSTRATRWWRPAGWSPTRPLRVLPARRRPAEHGRADRRLGLPWRARRPPPAGVRLRPRPQPAPPRAPVPAGEHRRERHRRGRGRLRRGSVRRDGQALRLAAGGPALGRAVRPDRRPEPLLASAGRDVRALAALSVGRTADRPRRARILGARRGAERGRAGRQRHRLHRAEQMPGGSTRASTAPPS